MAKKNTKNSGSKIVSILLAGLMVAAGVACGIGWRKAIKLEKQVNELIKEREENTDTIPMLLSAYSIVAEDYEKYGIPERATNTKLIVADFTPEGTTDKRVRWTWKWKDTSITDSVEDYVCFTPAANNGANCAVGCLQPFINTILLTCTSVADSKITSTTNIEFVTRYTSLFGDGHFYMQHFTDSIDLFEDLYTADDDYGSVFPDSFEADVKIEISQDLYSYLNQKGCDVAAYIEYENVTGSIPASTTTLYGNGWANEFNALDGSAVAQWCLDKNDDCIGKITATVRCYYKGEYIYEFKDIKDWCLSAGCLLEMAVPPQGVNTPPEIVL